jgi:uncharacterized membrane protein
LALKVVGIVLLLVSVYLTADTVLLSERLVDDTARAHIYPLVAIVLVLMVRVLQAEKHRRER